MDGEFTNNNFLFPEILLALNFFQPPPASIIPLVIGYGISFWLALTVKPDDTGFFTLFSQSPFCINPSQSEGVLHSRSGIRHCHSGCDAGCVVSIQYILFGDFGEDDGVASDTQRIIRRSPEQDR